MVEIEGNIVEEYKIGNTTIKISDAAYKDKTAEDIDRILANIVAIGWRIFNPSRLGNKESKGGTSDV